MKAPGFGTIAAALKLQALNRKPENLEISKAKSLRAAEACPESPQKPSIEEYTLNHIKDP